jgi:two-component system NtrC family sensor kinase
MRLGVSTKVFLAYAVLLTAFAATSAFSVAYLNSTREHVLAHNRLLDLQNAVESCRRQLELFDQGGLEVRPTLSGAYLETIRFSLEDARHKVELFLDEGASGRWRREFEDYRGELGGLERLRGTTAQALPSSFSDHKEEFKQRKEGLRRAIEVLRKRLETDSLRVAEELSEKQKSATSAAIGLGVFGLFGAIGAAVSLWRTIRPLRELRVRARQIASGDYDQRIGLRSHDEIGDLAREFDAMAHALQEREQRLIHSERLATVGKVAAQITHEIRNPLASIGLSAELLGDELGPEQREANRLLGAISGEVDRLSEITESYLRFVRLPRPVLEREDLVAIVTSVMEFARAELSQAGIRLELVAPAPVPEIAADENQLRQALLNLIRNAKEAMPEGGRLRVTVAAPSPDQVSVAVTDSGPGIPSDHALRVFEPFFSTKASGTGLGLALVQQIVAEHGGQITIRSPADGSDAQTAAGTTFLLEFPALPAGTTAQHPAPEGRDTAAGPPGLRGHDAPPEGDPTGTSPLPTALALAAARPPKR